jgi:hypothetical protein
MAQKQNLCPICKQPNSEHRIWCSSCGEPLPVFLANPQNSEQTKLATRKQLYTAVLDDIQNNSTATLVAGDALQVVVDYCQQQIEFINDLEDDLRRQEKVYPIACSAHRAATENRFTLALDLLQQCLTESQGDPIFQEAIYEVSERHRQNDLLLQAENLLTEANACLESSNIDEALCKLERAERIAPSHSRIIPALSDFRSRVESMIRAQDTVPTEEFESTEQQEEVEIPYATLIEPTSAAVGNAPVSSVPLLENSTTVEPQNLPTITTAFVEEEEDVPSPLHRLIESASQWSSLLKPFLLDNVGWFVGVFLVIAGFAVLIVSFWGTIQNNHLLMHSLVYLSLSAATGLFFSAAYFMRLRYPQLEISSNVLLVIVALLIPLVFASAVLTSLIPSAPAAGSPHQNSTQISG